MASSVTVKVEGLSELGIRMKSLSEKMNNNIARAATGAAASVIRKRAQSLVPVDTGALKKGIIVKRLRPSETPFTSEHIVTVSTREMKKYVEKSRHARVELQGPIAPVTVNGKTYRAKKLIGLKENYESLGDFYYAHFIEYGTVKLAAKPFMRPAYDGGKEQAVEAMRVKIDERLTKAGV